MRKDASFRSDLAAAVLIEQIVRETYASTHSREIQPLQWSILRYLARTPEPHCTMSKTRDFLGLTHAPVVRAINTLVKRGLVMQAPNPRDARSNTLSLTQKGLDVLELDPILKVVERVKALPEGERKVFKRLVRSLAMSPRQSESDFDESYSGP